MSFYPEHVDRYAHDAADEHLAHLIATHEPGAREYAFQCVLEELSPDTTQEPTAANVFFAIRNFYRQNRELCVG